MRLKNIIHTLFNWAKLTISKCLPDFVVLNWLFVIRPFLKYHKRFPRPIHAPDAAFEDFIFSRKIRPCPLLHEICVDKQNAKLIAQSLCPAVKAPRTIAVMELSKQTKLSDVERFLLPYKGKNLVAKPTHVTGGVIYLKKSGFEELKRLYKSAQRNFFFNDREVQYKRLPWKIIIEEMLGDGNPPDYRLFCSRGKVFFCQYDQDRFIDHRQALFTVPGFRHIPIDDINPLPDPLPRKPRHWKQMLKIASDLSKPFDFVRVDLYDLPDGVYFSEFTFTPNGGLLPFRDKEFSRKLLQNVLLATRKTRV